MKLVAQRDDIVSKLDLAVKGAGESQLRAGSDVVDELQHRPAFVFAGALRWIQLLQHRDRGEIAARNVLPGVRATAGAGIEAVGECTDASAATVDALLQHLVRLLHGHRLALHRAGVFLGLQLGANDSYVRHRCHGASRAEREVSFEQPRVDATCRCEPEASRRKRR